MSFIPENKKTLIIPSIALAFSLGGLGHTLYSWSEFNKSIEKNYPIQDKTYVFTDKTLKIHLQIEKEYKGNRPEEVKRITDSLNDNSKRRVKHCELVNKQLGSNKNCSALAFSPA